MMNPKFSFKNGFLLCSFIIAYYFASFPSVSTVEDACTFGLRDALNAAISIVIGSGELSKHLLPLWENEQYSILLQCPPSPSALKTSVPWPKVSRANIQSDVLATILNRGRIRIAGFKTNTDPPIGFFADYTRAIIRVISQHYEKELLIEWLYFENHEQAIGAVINNDADMTDIYFPLALASIIPVGDSALDTASKGMVIQAICPVIASTLNICYGDDAARNYLLMNSTLEMKKNCPVAVDSQEHCRVIDALGLPLDAHVSNNGVASVKDKTFSAFIHTRKSDSLACTTNGLKVEKLATISLGPLIKRVASDFCLSQEHNLH